MKTRLIQFLLCFGLLTGIVAETGCKSTPNQIAYKSAAATVATVDSAMQAWAQYVVTERARIAALKPIDQGSQAADLLRAEGKVREAFGRYQSAVASAGVGVATASSASAAPEVQGAAAALLSVIQSNTKR